MAEKTGFLPSGYGQGYRLGGPTEATTMGDLLCAEQVAPRVDRLRDER
ncbi:hypothetical protein ACX80O_08155 [Arthrobacter sp. Hz1]